MNLTWILVALLAVIAVGVVVGATVRTVLGDGRGPRSRPPGHVRDLFDPHVLG